MKDLKAKQKEIKERFLSKKKETKGIDDIHIIGNINKEAQRIKSERVELLKVIIAKKKLLKPAIRLVGSEEELRLKAEFKEKKDNLTEQKETYRRKFKVTRKEAYERAIDIMTEVGIPEARKRFRSLRGDFNSGSF